MTTVDLIAMAREAGFAIDVSTDPNSPPSWWGAGHDDRFKALVELVRADERENGQRWFDAVTAQHKAEILAEREACLNCYSPDDTATDWADKIRARGNT